MESLRLICDQAVFPYPGGRCGAGDVFRSTEKQASANELLGFAPERVELVCPGNGDLLRGPAHSRAWLGGVLANELQLRTPTS